jgi:hypothetical protein
MNIKKNNDILLFFTRTPERDHARQHNLYLIVEMPAFNPKLAVLNNKLEV